MKPLELCEPLFQYVCKLNRMGRSGAGAAEATVRADIIGLLQDIQQKSGSDARVAAEMKQLELPLVFFVDSVIAESELPFAASWNQHRLAYDRFNELAGDEKFFDLLEQTLQDSSPEASERLAVYYTCLGLGFTGIYKGQPEYLRKTMMSIAPRIRNLMDTDPNARICPETYENLDQRNLVQPPGARLVFVGILFICFSLAVIVAYIWMYREASKNLRANLPRITQHEPQAAPVDVTTNK